MRSDSAGGFTGYPMVEEEQATGVAAGVYAQLLDGMPFVPSLFKSLALRPGYLVLASEQASAVLQNDVFGALAEELSASVRRASTHRRTTRSARCSPGSSAH